MFYNFIIVALRNLKRQFLYSLVNIVGLAVGIACSLVIFLYVHGEWSHDRHFRHADRIYRVGVSFFDLGRFATGPELLGDVLPKEFEGVEAFTRFDKNSEELVTVGTESFPELAYYVDSSFFTVFSYDFAEGDPAHAVKKGFSAVLTESMARKYFGDTHVLGKVIEVGKEKVPFTITGIVRDDRRRAHLNASLWLSWELDRKQSYVWPSAAVYNYVLLRERSTQQDLTSALDRIIEKHVHPASWAKQSLAEYLQDANSVRFFVHPLRDIYLKSRLNRELSPGGNETNLYIFSIVAFFILILAAVNFINLTTARAGRRVKEIGIRKTLGTSRASLVTQFLLESVIVSLVAMALALGFAELFLMAFYWITGQHLVLSLWTNGMNILWVILFAIGTGLVSGLYPAVYLTSFRPVKGLKGAGINGGGVFRHALVVFQFTVSISLIICTVIILQQLFFIKKKDLGFDPQHVISMDELELSYSAAEAFKEEMMRQSGVTNASLHRGQPGSKAIMSFYMFQAREMPQAITINTYFGDHAYLDVMGLRLLKGRDFDRSLVSDTAAVILNESAVRALYLGDNPIGAEVNKSMRVIGVVSDFHWESLRNEIGPVAIMLVGARTGEPSGLQLALKCQDNAIPSIVRAAGDQWKKLGKDEPLKYHFMDDNFGALVKKEEVFGKAIGFFTILAIFISCLGLFGLAAYTAENRTKEIGIRKVLGATAGNIVVLLNRQFTRLVLFAIVIAVPLSYYVARQWLDTFAYQVPLKLWVFVAGSALGLFISWSTVSYLSLKASRTNPAETLKVEG